MKTEWISIKDKLPPDFKEYCEHDYVWVYAEKASRAPSPLFGIAQWQNGKWDICDEGGAHSCTGWYELMPEDITHWRRFEWPERILDEGIKE
jgi:hypothetical protein